MSQWIDRALHAMPFVLMATGRPIHMNSQRIFEAVLIAVLTAVGTGWTVTIRLDERDKFRAVQMETLTSEVRHLRSEITDNKLKIGDRWTATDQRGFMKELETKFRDHEIRGHWDGPNRANKLD